MKLRKIIKGAALVAAAAVALTGCSSNGSPQSSSTASSNPATSQPTVSATADESNTPDGEVFRIGAVQIVEHEALNASYDGFVQALADNGYVDGENIQIDRQNAQGDTNNLSSIGDRFVNNDVDMILAITTDSAQVMAGKTTEIPIIATAVTSYTTAGLVDSDEAPGGNLTGTSDMNPVEAQIELIAKLWPEAQTIGIIYNSSEDNSVLQVGMAKEQIESLGLKSVEATVTNASEVQQAMQSLVSKCDVVYIPTDNTIASAMPTVSGVAAEAKIPTMCGESNMVTQGGLITMGINYYDLGYQTGIMALDIINGKNPGEMPIQYASTSEEITINGQAAEEIGFTIPDEYKEFIIDPTSAD